VSAAVEGVHPREDHFMPMDSDPSLLYDTEVDGLLNGPN
jgi:hypothetical protein